MLGNMTNITLTNITQIANVSSVPEMLVRLNHIAFGGWFWFCILWVLLIILYVIAQTVKDKPLVNFMYASAIVSVISLFSRAVQSSVIGFGALLTDHQMWVFPLLTLVLAAIIWGSKE